VQAQPELRNIEIELREHSYLLCRARKTVKSGPGPLHAGCEGLLVAVGYTDEVTVTPYLHVSKHGILASSDIGARDPSSVVLRENVVTCLL
jgi:hypothetical protein